MENKKIVMILLILTIIFTIIGGTFAYLNWESDNMRKTSITFTVNPDFTCGADGGGNITSNDVNLIPTDCTNSEYAIKRVINTNVTTTNDKVVSMDLWLDINSISTNLSNSDNFKYVFSKNGNTCDSGAISQGTFKNKHRGDKILLLDDTEYATLSDKYYLYIWLDEDETSSSTMNQSFDFSLGGICQDHGLEKTTLVSFNQYNTPDYFRESAYKTQITDIYFIYDEDLPNGVITNYVKTYALSTNSARPITGYLVENTDEGATADTYKLYISSQYKIYAQNLYNIFNGMSAVKSIIFDNFDTSGTTTMYSMFMGCSSLISLDLSGFNTSNVTSMYQMFRGCTNLETVDLTSFDTSKITTMYRMFYYCSSLTSLDVTNFNTARVTNMERTFIGCSNLTTLDLSYFNTARVNTMAAMFYECSKLATLDLSGFNTSIVTDMNSMFYHDYQLSKIYVSELWNTDAVTSSGYMFSSCSKLPNYNSSYVTKTRAHYGTGGYLTYKPYNGS